MPSLSRMRRIVAAVSFLTLVAAPAAQATPKNESAAQRFHRKGTYCMDEIERPQCAIDQFEALLAENTPERALVTDAMLRLIRLYEESGQSSEVRRVLRKFWDAGMKLRQQGQVPYSTRFIPADMTILVNFDPPRILDAPVLQRVGEDLIQYAFTCDASVRNDIRLRREWNQAERKAKSSDKPAYAHVYEQRDREQERRESRSKDIELPIFVSATCPVARALEFADVSGWRRMTGAFDHRSYRRSVGLAEIPGLEARLVAAEAAGRITKVAHDRWRLTDTTDLGREVHLARLDLEELTVGEPAQIDTMVAARKTRKTRMGRALEKLLRRTPKDTDFFFLATAQAMQDLGAAGMRKSTGKLLQALLPRPEGLQIAVVAHEYLGLFARMPTNTPVKGRVLVGLAERIIAGRSSKDPALEKWLRNLDVAEAEDRRALLIAYVLTGQQIEQLMWN